MFRQINPIVSILIGLAAFGLLYKLFTNPMSLIMQLIITAGIVVLLLFIFSSIMNRRYSNSDYSAYRKAVKQSKNKYKTSPTAKDSTSIMPKKVQMKNKPKTTTNKSKTSASRKRRDTNLTVIEGKKGKKRNRALF
ncbi:SA1362 family protein [Bacillus solimangrovi]|uniref:Uncharacterized protein n=1 Tax=Bacillus solimangrovi TaxID=1305675 RepID=A0A1E5LK65_9BACI|nr:SA1362 family protein [Bacillus solimangrovi]OEH94474.1 hypothetical protein BFG57_07300 [Bacillus solimangrovi]